MYRALLVSALASLGLAACGQAEPGHAAPDAFVPVTDPSVTTLSPDHGPAAGGTTVTINGTGFADAGDNQVLLDGVLVSGVTSAGDTSLSFVAPPGAPGASVTVTVFNRRGTITMDGAYTYNELPTVSAVSGPVQGVGGATVSVTGTGFQANEAGTPTVTVGGMAVTNVQVQSDSLLTFTAPAISAPPVGAIDLVVGNANGTATLARGYRYTHPGILMIGNNFYDGTQYTIPLYYIDPLAPSPTPIQISTIHNTYRLRGIAPNGSDVLAIYTSIVDGYVNLARLDPFTGRLTQIAPITVAGAKQSLISHLTLQNGAYYVINPRATCCPYAAQIYRIDVTTGVATAVGATFTTPTRAMSMGPGAGNQLNLYPNSTQPVYATTTAGAAPVALGPALSGNGAYPRGAFLIGGTIYGIMSYNPTVLPQSDTSHQALVTIDPAAGTFAVKSIFPQQRYRQPGITPATW